MDEVAGNVGKCFQEKVPGSKVSLVLAGLSQGSEISRTAKAKELTLLAFTKLIFLSHLVKKFWS